MTFKVIRGQGQGEEMTSVPYRDYILFVCLSTGKNTRPQWLQRPFGIWILCHAYMSNSKKFQTLGYENFVKISWILLTFYWKFHPTSLAVRVFQIYTQYKAISWVWPLVLWHFSPVRWSLVRVLPSRTASHSRAPLNTTTTFHCSQKPTWQLKQITIRQGCNLGLEVSVSRRSQGL